MDPAQLEAGARTVAHLAVYFEELRQTALDLKSRIQARSRGYFTPSEDEETRHLLISYWQARCALLELVTSFRTDTHLPSELRPAAFLVAYAAAILLVDAARFIRETFGDSPAIVAKLNEPEPHFGIPPGTYDTVQRSLLSTRHAWHLYHAMQYFAEHVRELQTLAQDELLRPAMEVIVRHGDRLQVAASRFASTSMRVRAQAWISTQHDLLSKALYGLMKTVSGMTADLYLRPGHHPRLPIAVQAELGQLLRPGDVFITRKEHALTNYFLPGYWPHAALYLGDASALEAMGLQRHTHVRPRWAQLLRKDANEPRHVLEAMKDGVHIRPVTSPFSSDAIVVLRPHASAETIAQALARGLFHEGKPYDFDFDFTRSDRLVCTEVVYRAYDGLGNIRFQLTRRAGRMTLAAIDLVSMAEQRNGFDPVAVYSPAHAAKLVTGDGVDAVLGATKTG